MRHRLFPLVLLLFAVMTAGVAPAQDFDKQEFAKTILADIGVTEAELTQFGVIVAGVMEPYQQFMDENTGDVTRENYVEKCDFFFDHLISPIINDYRAEAANFFTEDQYSKMTLRLYQVAENFPEAFRLNEIFAGELFRSFLLPDVVPLTEEQLAELAAVQKEAVTDLAIIEITLKEEHAELVAELEALFKELEKAETDEAKAAVQEKLSKVMAKTADLMREPVQKAFAKMRGKLDSLLTAEQKAKLAQIKQDIPDYLKQALVKMQKSEGDGEVSAAWRPGLHSWMPGQGAPRDRNGHPGETRPEKPPKSRTFPE